ncbi:hypothetical protein [Granulicella sp. S190]|uniref:hypothetical protein n=1 Tax=Granulicella sp. S190 TaxID=1747226 RepID=UPI00131E7D54|nr:hypothetical protein [Granulicella sp. S190]
METADSSALLRNDNKTTGSGNDNNNGNSSGNSTSNKNDNGMTTVLRRSNPEMKVPRWR